MILYVNQLLRKIVLWLRFNLSMHEGKLVVLNENDRRLGLTTMIIKKAIRQKHMIIVPDESHKKIVCLMIRDLYPYYSPHRCERTVITINQLKERGFTYKDTYLVDNSVSTSDLMNISYVVKAQIAGGFINLHNNRDNPPKYVKIYNINHH